MMTMEFHFNPALVLLSIAVSILASYTALNLASSVWEARNQRSRIFWLAGGSVSMGIGIWSMHFIGMLAFSMPGMTMAYDRPLMALSIIVAICASGLALHVVSDPKRIKPAYVFSGVTMGAAIAGMHYIGMASMRMEARIEWNFFLVGLSVLIAVGASIAALYISFYLRDEKGMRSHIGRVAGALGMGFAIAGMHYTGMYAAQFIHDPTALAGPRQMGALIASSNLTTLVSLATIIVLAIALSGSFFDQALRKRTQAVSDLQEERQLRERFVSSLTHDLRTPITAAQLSAQLMARVIQEPEKVLQLNAKILENLKRADDMIRDLLDAHRISANEELPLSKKDMDFSKLIRNTIDGLRTIHGDHFRLSVPEVTIGYWDEKYLKIWSCSCARLDQLKFR
jgi:NO-binding membrane sensor protein with MHYT domain